MIEKTQQQQQQQQNKTFCMVLVVDGCVLLGLSDVYRSSDGCVYPVGECIVVVCIGWVRSMCVHVCVCACVRACMCACVCVCVCVYVCAAAWGVILLFP